MFIRFNVTTGDTVVVNDGTTYTVGTDGTVTPQEQHIIDFFRLGHTKADPWTYGEYTEFFGKFNYIPGVHEQAQLDINPSQGVTQPATGGVIDVTDNDTPEEVQAKVDAALSGANTAQ